MADMEWGTVLWDGVDERGNPLRIVYVPEYRRPYVTQLRPPYVEPRWWRRGGEQPWKSVSQAPTWDEARRFMVRLTDGYAVPPVPEPYRWD